MKSITDISGRKVSFFCTVEGLLGQFTDGDGSSQPKNFKFTYDATQGNKNVKLVTATDSRGHDTQLAYYAPQTGDDPKYHWWTKTVTDRLNGDTGFAYAADTASTKFTGTTVTDAETHATKYVTDDFGRPVQTTNAKSQTAKMSWDVGNSRSSPLDPGPSRGRFPLSKGRRGCARAVGVPGTPRDVPRL